MLELSDFLSSLTIPFKLSYGLNLLFSPLTLYFLVFFFFFGIISLLTKYFQTMKTRSKELCLTTYISHHEIQDYYLHFFVVFLSRSLPTSWPLQQLARGLHLCSTTLFQLESLCLTCLFH